MHLLSSIAQEMQDLWRLLFPRTVLEVEDALPMGVETCYQRISYLIQEDGRDRTIILNSRDLMPPITLGRAALSPRLAERSLNLFTENQNKFPRGNRIRRSILDQIAHDRIVASADFDTHLHKSQP